MDIINAKIVLVIVGFLQILFGLGQCKSGTAYIPAIFAPSTGGWIDKQECPKLFWVSTIFHFGFGAVVIISTLLLI